MQVGVSVDAIFPDLGTLHGSLILDTLVGDITFSGSGSMELPDGRLVSAQHVFAGTVVAGTVVDGHAWRPGSVVVWDIEMLLSRIKITSAVHGPLLLTVEGYMVKMPSLVADCFIGLTKPALVLPAGHPVVDASVHSRELI